MTRNSKQREVFREAAYGASRRRSLPNPSRSAPRKPFGVIGLRGDGLSRYREKSGIPLCKVAQIGACAELRIWVVTRVKARPLYQTVGLYEGLFCFWEYGGVHRMFKFFKLFGDQYLGIWILGAVLFVIQEIPYMIMPLFDLKENPIMNMRETSQILEICEKALGSLCVALMIFVVHKNSTFFSMGAGKERVFFFLAGLVLLLNFFGWALYFSGHQSVFVMMFFIVLLPPLYYVFIGIWRSNIILTVMGILFLIVHFVHVLGNLTLESKL